MSVSINDSMYSYLTQTANNANSSAAASGVNSTIQGLDANSSEAEMKQAIKDFESYFVEQMLGGDEDSSNSQMTEYFMGRVNEQIADKIVDQVGDRLTQTLYEQMCRNYGVPAGTDEE